MDKINPNTPIKVLRQQVFDNEPNPDVPEWDRYLQRLRELAEYKDIKEVVDQSVSLFLSSTTTEIEKSLKIVNNDPFQQHRHSYNYICRQLLKLKKEGKDG